MLIAMIVFPILTVKWERKRKEKHEQKRQERYKQYLAKKRNDINKIKKKQRSILYENYLNTEQCVEIILKKESRLWERKIENSDFLTIRIGTGNVPTRLDVEYQENGFTMEDDNLLETLNEITQESKYIEDAPITVSLAEKNISSIIVREKNAFEKFTQNIIIQLITFQSYEDLKLVFLLKERNEKYWEYVKMLPHTWNDSKEIRFFADEYDDMQEISRYLEEEFKRRKECGNNSSYKSFSPYYLIITDDYRKIETLKIITEILNSKENLGFSILCITDDLTQLPDECNAFIDIDSTSGVFFENEISSNNQIDLKLDFSVTIFFEKICQQIANIPIRYSKTKSMLLPNNCTFLEMYDVGLIEQLNILERWRKNDSTLSLKAPIGVDTSGMLIYLDIHEKAHGPHGLIAGTTGSGKSELIITYILSMAINYSPYDVNFLLIDYKGGGLAGAFKKSNMELPHLVGTITNIETNELQRTQDSIQSELKRRQIIFNEAKNITDEGTMDIYKYHKLFHEGVVKEPIPHLLIICDEFAELKQQQPEFMDELISVSRIGRSLGVHLILATQKPAGIVNDQIRGNSKFAICLKVQDKSDSNDVIKKPLATELRNSGQFYLQVGNDEYFVLGQSAWSGAPYYPSNKIKKKIDNSIQFISNIGTSIKETDDTLQKSTNSNGEQLINILKHICNLAKQEKIKMKNLWLDKIPETIYVNDLIEKYHVKKKENVIETIIGEYDDPSNQKQGLIKYDLSEVGNILVYGNAGSGKETLLSTIIYNLINEYSTEKVWLYLLDFGTESLKIFKDAPHVGDVIFISERENWSCGREWSHSEREKIERFFGMIINEINVRKKILSDYNGDYQLYIEKNNKNMPRIVVVVNNYPTFSEYYKDKYEEIFQTLTREGIKCGINVITSVNTYNDMRYRLTQNFKEKLVLQLNDNNDYYSILENSGRKKPSNIFGRGLIKLQDNKVYEFQTAKICDATQFTTHIRSTIERLNSENTIKATVIPTLPKRIVASELKPYIKDISKLPVGITKKDLKIFEYNFEKRLINIISAKNVEIATEFTYNLIEELNILGNVNVNIFDAEQPLKNGKNIIKDKFAQLALEIQTGKVKNSMKSICIIIGLDKFFDDIDYVENEFVQILKKAEERGTYTFIIVESTNKFKNHQYDNWFKNFITGDSGIYVGNGIDEQYLISVSDRHEIENNCGKSFGHVVNDGKAVVVKLIGMTEKEEEH